MFPKNKQNKLRQTKKKEMKEGSYLLNYTFFIRKNFIKNEHQNPHNIKKILRKY